MEGSDIGSLVSYSFSSPVTIDEKAKKKPKIKISFASTVEGKSLAFSIIINKLT